MRRALIFLVYLLLCACGGTSTGPSPVNTPSPYSAVSTPERDLDLHVFEPFNYGDNTYPNGLSGQEGGFGFAHPWNDADGDVTDRVIGGSALGVVSDMAPPSTGGRSIHFAATGTSIFRDLDQTHGEDGSTVWVSFRWICTDTSASETLQVVDFNDSTGAFGCMLGQARTLAGDDAADGMYDLGDHSSQVSADVAFRDQAVHFVLLRFTFGAADMDAVACWWDPVSTTFDEGMPDASIMASDASFSRITLRSTGGADSLDELHVGSTLASVTQPAQRMAVYRIGNSLTWDSQPEAIEALAGQAGFLHDTGFHINCGNTLENIYAAPAQICIPSVPEYGTWDVALSGAKWDVVTFQPFYGGTSTLGSDEDAILGMIAHTRTNPLNTHTRYYVWGAWPMRPDFESTFTGQVIDDDATPTIMAREYFAHLMERLRAATDASIYLVPVGEVLHDLDQRLRAGAVPGLTSIDQLYRDDFHLALGRGRFIAGVTTFATLYATDPQGLVKPERWYGNSIAPFTPEFYAAVYQSVWSVVSGHAYTGVAPSP